MKEVTVTDLEGNVIAHVLEEEDGSIQAIVDNDYVVNAK